VDVTTFLIALGVIFVVIALWSVLTNPKRAEGDVTDRVEDIADKSSTEAGWTAAKVGSKRAEARAEFNEALRREAESQVNLHRTRAEAQKAKNREPIEVRLGQLRDEQELIIQQAATHNAPILADTQQRLAIAQEDNRLFVTENATAVGLDSVSYTEVRKILLTDQIRLDTRWKEKEQDLKAAFLFQQAEYQKLYLLLEYIKGLYLQADKETGRSKDIIEEHIKFMEQHFRERQKLLQQSPTPIDEGEDDGEG
jgi:hypothetical protein